MHHSLGMLRDLKMLKPFFFIRDSIMDKLGLFNLKRRLKKHVYFKRLMREDNRKRQQVAEAILSVPEGWLKSHGQANLIVSLTSHGKRVERTAPYAIYSILQQKLLPKRIILNLNRGKWADDELPYLLQHLQKVGIDIAYVEDIGPYTKFLPTLKNNPNEIIVTIDDDIYYDDNMVGELYSAYMESDGRSIICRNGMRLVRKKGSFLTYTEQPHISKFDNAPGVPFGVSGVLFPPNIFDGELFNNDVYKKLCPNTDDLWIGIMSLRSRINVLYVHNNSWALAQVVDHNDEFNPDKSTAMHFANDEKANEIFRDLVNYYHLED